MAIDVKDLIASVNKRASVTAGDLLGACEGIVSSIAEALAVRDRTNEQLTTRVAALEARPAGIRWMAPSSMARRTRPAGSSRTAAACGSAKQRLWSVLAIHRTHGNSSSSLGATVTDNRRTLSLKGCANMDEARARISAFVAVLQLENEQRFETSIIGAVDRGELSLDAATDAIEAGHECNAEVFAKAREKMIFHVLKHGLADDD